MLLSCFECRMATLFFAGPTPDLKNRRRRTTPNEYENSKYIHLSTHHQKFIRIPNHYKRNAGNSSSLYHNTQIKPT